MRVVYTALIPTSEDYIMRFSKNTWYILKDEGVKDFSEWMIKNTSDTTRFINSIDALIVDLQQGFRVLSVSGCLGGLLEIQLYDGRVMRGKDYHHEWSSLTISGCAEFFYELGRYPDLWRTGRSYVTGQTYFDSFRASSKTNRKIADQLLEIFGSVKRICFQVEEIDGNLRVGRLLNNGYQDKLNSMSIDRSYILSTEDIRYFYPLSHAVDNGLIVDYTDENSTSEGDIMWEEGVVYKVDPERIEDLNNNIVVNDEYNEYERFNDILRKFGSLRNIRFTVNKVDSDGDVSLIDTDDPEFDEYICARWGAILYSWERKFFIEVKTENDKIVEFLENNNFVLTMTNGLIFESVDDIINHIDSKENEIDEINREIEKLVARRKALQGF